MAIVISEDKVGDRVEGHLVLKAALGSGFWDGDEETDHIGGLL